MAVSVIWFLFGIKMNSKRLRKLVPSLSFMGEMVAKISENKRSGIVDLVCFSQNTLL